ncbi:hypothetical protein GORHZ_028_00320 [Gordonia rhizosphera NBRC 16068]|uniref:Uncharacterized protein n=1 Tax=Gordonia rhizosphera NBRC 16068 TaxID=1108045 RepID=K6UYM6_9ACTN|nr:hypothetical protein GORHZ_028_00320 [Gordonia rhizosphera NBRC 16068]
MGPAEAGQTVGDCVVARLGSSAQRLCAHIVGYLRVNRAVGHRNVTFASVHRR